MGVTAGGSGTRPTGRGGLHSVDGISMLGAIKNDVIRVWVKDSWQPPALLLEIWKIAPIPGTDHKVRSYLLSVLQRAALEH